MKAKFFVVFVLGILILSACGSQVKTPENTPIAPVIAEDVIIAEGRVEPVESAELNFSSSGIVGNIFFKEGDEVNKGDVLAVLQNIETLRAEEARALEASILAQQTYNEAESAALQELGAAYDELRIAQQRLDDFAVPSKFKGLTPAEAVTKTMVAVEKARTAYEPYRGYKPTTKLVKDLNRKLDDAWADYNQAVDWMDRSSALENAQNRVDVARSEYEKLASENSSGEPSLALARFDSAQSNLTAARAALRNAQIIAPFSGTLTSIDLTYGESVSPSQVVASVANLSSWIVKTTDLTEIDVVNLTEGQIAQVTLDALPDQTISGTIERIGQTYAEKQGDIVYTVTIVLTDTLPQMRWGMTAEVKFPR